MERIVATEKHDERVGAPDRARADQPAAPLSILQQSVGNRAVALMLQRQRRPGDTEPSTSGVGASQATQHADPRTADRAGLDGSTPTPAPRLERSPAPDPSAQGGTPASRHDDPSGSRREAAAPGPTPVEEQDTGTGDGGGLDAALPDVPVAGDSDLVSFELAEHERWAGSFGSLGTAGSDERAQFILQQAGQGMRQGVGQGFVEGLAMGLGARVLGSVVGTRLATMAVSRGLAVTPIPGLGSAIGGVMAVVGLARRDWGATSRTVSRMGTGTGYERMANDLEGICEILDVATNILDVIAGVLGVISVGMWAAAVASAGALSPLAATLSAIAVGINLTTTAANLATSAILRPLVASMRALHTFTTRADPATVEASGGELANAAGQVGGALGGAVGARAAHIGAGPRRTETPPADGTPTPHPTPAEPTLRVDAPETRSGRSPDDTQVDIRIPGAEDGPTSRDTIPDLVPMLEGGGRDPEGTNIYVPRGDADGTSVRQAPDEVTAVFERPVDPDNEPTGVYERPVDPDNEPTGVFERPVDPDNEPTGVFERPVDPDNEPTGVFERPAPPPDTSPPAPPVDQPTGIIRIPDHTPTMRTPDRAAAESQYWRQVSNDPLRESGLYLDRSTGEYIVMQGGPGSVAHPPGTGPYDLVYHSHPPNNVRDLPSPAGGDYSVLQNQHGRGPAGARQESTLHFPGEANPQPRTSPSTFGSTMFDYDPTNPMPLGVETRYPDGRVVRARFRTFQEYATAKRIMTGSDQARFAAQTRAADARLTQDQAAARQRVGEMVDANRGANLGGSTGAAVRAAGDGVGRRMGGDPAGAGPAYTVALAGMAGLRPGESITVPINPTYEGPPGTPQQLAEYRATAARARAAATDLAGTRARARAQIDEQTRHQTGLGQAAQATRGLQDESARHRSEVGETRSANSEEQSGLAQSFDRGTRYAGETAAFGTLIASLQTFRGFAHLFGYLPGSAGTGARRMAGDAARLIDALGRARSLDAQNQQLAAGQQQSQANSTRLTGVDQQAQATGAGLQRNGEQIGALQQRNDATLAQSRSVEEQAGTELEAANETGAQANVAHDDLQERLQSWAAGHRQARDQAIAQAQAQLERIGLRAVPSRGG